MECIPSKPLVIAAERSGRVEMPPASVCLVTGAHKTGTDAVAMATGGCDAVPPKATEKKGSNKSTELLILLGQCVSKFCSGGVEHDTLRITVTKKAARRTQQHTHISLTRKRL